MIVYILIILVFAIYLYGTRNHNYWTKRNIKNDQPLPIFGNYFNIFFGIESIAILANKIYKKYPNEKVVGNYCGNRPELIIRDPEIVRDILSVNFSHFHMRGLGRDVKQEPLLLNIFSVEGDPWKLLRHRLTPAFTTAKLKSMFPLIVKCARKLHGLGDEIVASGGECDVRELMAKFTTEFIGACGLGIEMDTITKENTFFRSLGQKIFERTLRDIIFTGFWDVIPETRKMLSIYDRDFEKVFSAMITKVFEQRNYKPTGRNDFIDLLLDLSTRGKLKGESIEHRHPDGTPKQAELDMDLLCMIAQVFVFFVAGFETSSSSTSYLLHELAFNPEEQKKVQKEIDEVLARYDNELCYDAVAEMTYLDLAFKESLRIFPPLGVLNRECVSPYKISQLGVTIDAGVRIVIPIHAMQNDKKYFDNPEKFNPERFANYDNNKSNYTYLPFGEGPRMCIGARLGHMQSLAGLAAVLHRFSVEPSEKTRRELKINPRLNIVQGVADGLPLRLKLRNK